MRRELFALHLPNPERWEVSQAMLEREIAKAKKAKAELSGAEVGDWVSAGVIGSMNHGCRGQSQAHKEAT